MAKEEATVEELVRKIKRGELRLPEMQRRYVWRATRVRDLMDSLYRGYPSGAILVWETDEEVPLQEMAIGQEKTALRRTLLLLDGQQRLTSLAAVISGEPISVRGRVRPIELLFNLEHPEELSFVTEVDESDGDSEDRIEDETDSTTDDLRRRFNQMTFVVATKQLAQQPRWVKVTEVFKSTSDAPFLKAAGVTGVDDPRYDKYSKRLAKLRDIKNYIYRMDVLEPSLTYDEVTEIFVRVNSLGAKLRSSDLALAQITARWRGALEIFLQYQKKCAASGFDVDLGVHLKNLVAFATAQSRFLTVGNLSVETMTEAWKSCVQGMDFAVNFMRSNVGIDSISLLSSPFILITVGYYARSRGYDISSEEERELRKWVLLANAKGRYSRGSSETLLDQDLATIRGGGGPSELLNRLRLQVGRLDVVPEELEGRNQRSAVFKTMFLAFRDAKAADWYSNLIISLSHTGTQHRLQFHHIFPRAVLKSKFEPREIDDIANLAFIGGKSNRRIKDKPPSEYFPTLIRNVGLGPFTSQCIPTEGPLLEVDSYRSFISERRRLISARLNQFLGVG